MEATKQLAELSFRLSRRLIPLHYISSGGACTFAAAAGKQRIGPVSVSHFSPPTDAHVAFGYASSKWASEVSLEKLKARYRDWSLWTYRPSNITHGAMTIISSTSCTMCGGTRESCVLCRRLGAKLAARWIPSHLAQLCEWLCMQ